MTGRDYSYLKHILEAIEYIEDFSKKVDSADDLKNCPLERAAIERMLTIIGEAAKNISHEAGRNIRIYLGEGSQG